MLCVYFTEIGSKKEEDKEPLLGHVSMLLDVVATNKYIITSDRDEKIRVSLMEAPHVIQCFCLSHTEFITKTVVVESTSTLISFSGDGTMRSWNLDTGKLYQTVSLLDPNDKMNSSKLVPDVVSSTTAQHLFAVSFSGTNKVRIFGFSDKEIQSLNFYYDVSLPSDKIVFDACFAPSEGSNDEHDLFVLCSSHGTPCCIVVRCRTDSFTFCADDTTSNAINEFVSGIPDCRLRKRDLSQYFRLKVEGNVYEAFKRKRQQNNSKKPKLVITE